MMITDAVQSIEFRVLVSLRKIIRSVDIYSRRLNSEFGLTTPQLICLLEIVAKKEITLSKLTAEVNLSGSTVTGIVDRLEKKGFVVRRRSTVDRRKVYVLPTESGLEVALKSPSLIQDKLSESLSKLDAEEQLRIAESLERIVSLMEVENIKASPNLISNLPV